MNPPPAVGPDARDLRRGDETAKTSVRWKVVRDKDQLRDLGIPLETVTYSINYGMEEAQADRMSPSDFCLQYLRVVRKEAADLPKMVLTGRRTTG